jgi:uncharacterized protein YlxW (UPF0749 family)
MENQINSQTIEEKCQNVQYPHFENPFAVSSDEWSDRSLINSFIHNLEIEIILTEDRIKDYTKELENELGKSCHSEILINSLQKYINKNKRDIAKLKKELSVLKTEGMTDKDKLEKRSEIHLMVI